ncbi:MAG: divergent PAP2 family protein [Chloroflexi bacterium]|nr:divergent PAP2 family protein [Chloroflexota bacterium]
MSFSEIFNNHALMTAVVAWLLAQILKPPLEYLRRGVWNWGYLFSAGGMPSSHSSLMVGVTMGIGLHEGFNSAIFALAIAMTMIVIYDAAGVRREAGRHAEKINILFNELLAGHPISDKQLREVLGHTPMEVVGGIFLGLVVGILYRMWIG